MAKDPAFERRFQAIDVDEPSASDTVAILAKLAFTPLVISVMEKCFRLARENNQTYVSTEHLLLDIVSEGNGLALDILRRLAGVRAPLPGYRRG